MSHDGTLQSKVGLKTPVPVLARDFDADFQAIRDVLTDLRTCLAGKNASSEDIGSLELLLSEVLTNVVKHAYADGPRGQIRLALTCDGNSVYVDVRDFGSALPGGALPVGRPADTQIHI
ncbi:MAG: ATP-binding protein, partial [Alphaproteobacteria bacterium]|nr:ATP-binding protein [Alphaproteobacteria bacterium]